MFCFLGCLLSPSEYADLEAQAQDADGDGQGAVAYGGLDCDDSAPETYAGVPEQCDGLDNDCDQDIDEDIEGLPLFYPDQDNDGYGTADGARSAREQPEGFVAEAGDCDDSNPAVRPGQSESCGNGLDDDCSGEASACWREGDFTVAELGVVRALREPGSVAFWPDHQTLLVLDSGAPIELSLDGLSTVSEASKDADVSFELGAVADVAVAFQGADGLCLVPNLAFDRFQFCGLEDVGLSGEVDSLVMGSTFCGGPRSGVLRCVVDIETPPVSVSLAFDAVGIGPWSGAASRVAVAEGNVVILFSEGELLSGTTPTATLILPGTPTDLCLLDQAVVWADAEGTHLTSAAGETDTLTETTGTLSCMEAGSEYVLIVPSSKDRVEVVNLSGFGNPAWGAPLVVTLDASDALLANKATLAAADGQAYLFIAHGTELRRLELGLGL